MKTVVSVLLLLISSQSSFAEESAPCNELTDKAIDAALGDSDQIYNLGVEFYTGKCVKQNYAHAATLWGKSAALGDRSAKNNLGYLLSKGLGVEKDQARAVDLWREAALAGHVEAQLHLGDALFYGLGVDRDRARGLAWVLLAADHAESSDEPGAGPELLQMALDGKAEMLKHHPEMLAAAQALKGRLMEAQE